MFNAQYFRTFITLVETGSFTRTAQRLGMTQPGVSQHIRKLEDYLKMPLLERQGRRFSLTETGRRSYDYALRLFAEHEQFFHSLDDESLDSGECRLASPGSVGVMLYPFLLGQQQMRTGLTINYNFSFNHDIVSDLVAGRHDVGIVTESVRHPDINCEAWHQEPLCLLVPADFTGSGLADLMGIGYIGYTGGSDLAATLLRQNFPGEFRSMRHIPSQGFTSEVSAVLDAVARGLGFTVVSRLVLETSPWQRQVKELSLPHSLSETLYLVTLRDSRLPLRYLRLLEAFREYRQQEWQAL